MGRGKLEMNLLNTSIPGARVIESKSFVDGRGIFSRLFCAKELDEILGTRRLVQINHSMTRRVGAVRGLHYQNSPHSEMKVVRCIKGRVFDVAVDMRHESPTYLQWYGVELTSENNLAYVIPEGCAHGFQVLEPNSELLYLHTAFYTPEAEAAIRFDDPTIAVHWPLHPIDISERDLNHPLIRENRQGMIL